MVDPVIIDTRSVLPAGRQGRRISLTALVLCGACSAAAAQIPCGYEVSAVIQGPFCFGFAPTIPRDIGENGEVVGFYSECVFGPSMPFRWNVEEGFDTLTVGPYPSGSALDVDDETGWIVGAVGTSGTDGPFAVAWPATGVLNLGTLPGGNFSRAQGASNGRIVGRWGNNVTGDPGLQAFLWEDGVMMDLGPDLGTPAGDAKGINATGQITGWMGTAIFSDARAFIWQDGLVTELPPIPGGFTSEGWAINESGAVTGAGRWTDPQTEQILTRACFWQQGEILNLGVLPGFLRSAGLGVNDSGLVVGQLWGGTGFSTGFVWFDEQMADLNALIPPEAGIEILIAHAVNNAGQIVCDGVNQDNETVGILLTPIEPPLGDLNCDGTVGVEDFLAMLAAWGPCPSAGACPADFNDDGEVSVPDFLILLTNWG